MDINDTSAAAARIQMLETFDKLDERLATHKFLTGPLFSRADLSASALLFHGWSDEWPAPPELEEFVAHFRGRRFYEWAGRIYQDYRSGNDA